MEGDGMEAFPSGGGDKESFGVPKIKSHKELLKGMFQKNKLPPGMAAVK